MSSTPTTPAPAATFSPEQKWILVLVGAILVCTALFAVTIHAEDVRRRAAEATVKSDQVVIDQDKKQIAELQLQDQARDKAAAAQVSQIQAAAAAAKSPAQIVRYIHDGISAGAPQPIDLEIPPATAANPSPAAIATIPQIDLPFLRDKIQNCSIDAVKVPDLSGDLTSCKTQLQLAGEELSKMQKERDSWKTAAKGGTWAQRIKSGAVKVGIGIAIGVAIDAGARR